LGAANFAAPFLADEEIEMRKANDEWLNDVNELHRKIAECLDRLRKEDEQARDRIEHEIANPNRAKKFVVVFDHGWHLAQLERHANGKEMLVSRERCDTFDDAVELISKRHPMLFIMSTISKVLHEILLTLGAAEEQVEFLGRTAKYVQISQP
jgi:hypothetical protein